MPSLRQFRQYYVLIEHLSWYVYSVLSRTRPFSVCFIMVARPKPFLIRSYDAVLCPFIFVDWRERGLV